MSRLPKRCGWIPGVLAVVIGAQLVVRAWIMAGGWFASDDFVAMTQVSRGSLGETLSTFIAAGHLAVGVGVLEWLVQNLAPFSWAARVVVVLALLVLADFFVWRMLRRLFGHNWCTVLLFCGWAASSLLTTALTWWSAAGWFGLEVAATGAVLWLWVRLFQQPSGPNGARVVIALVAFTGGLFVSERMLFVAIPICALPFMLAMEAPLADALRIWRDVWVALVGLLSLCGAYLSLYLAVAAGPPLLAGGVVNAFWRGLLHTVVPTALGGPLNVKASGVTAGAATPTWWAVVSAIAVVVLVVLSLWVRRCAWRAWFALSVMTVTYVLAIAVVRSGPFGPEVVDDWRLFAGLGLMFPLFVGFAFFRTRTNVNIASVGAHDPLPARLRTLVRDYPIPLAIAAGGYLAAFAVTSVAVAQLWSQNPTRPFLERTIADIASNPTVSIFNQEVPEAVVPQVAGNGQRLPSTLLGGLPNPPAFDEAAPKMAVIDADGRLRPARILTGARTSPGTTPGCGWRIRPGARVIPLKSQLYRFSWMGQIGYVASGDFSVNITTDDATVTVPVSKGLGSVQFPLTGSVRKLTISDVPDGETLCVDEAIFGQPVPWPGQ